MSIQKCQKCEHPATHKVTRIVNGQAIDLYLCQEHAAETSPLQKKSPQSDLAQLLAGFLKKEQGQKAAETEAGTTDLRCPVCNLRFLEYRKTWLLGCSNCYEAFEKLLGHDLRKHHGTVRHCGKQPVPDSADGTDDTQLAGLRKRLAVAIEDEDFELAARLRDQIRTLRSSTAEPSEHATD